jgi:hypothetical protein
MFVIKDNLSFKLLKEFFNKFDVQLKSGTHDDIWIKEQVISNKVSEHLVTVALDKDTTESSLKKLSIELSKTKGIEDLWWIKKQGDSCKRGGAFDKIYTNETITYTDNLVILFIVEYNKKLKTLSLID